MRSLVRAAWRSFEISTRLRVVSPWAYLNWLVFPVIFAAIGLFVLTSTGYARVAYGVLGGGVIGFWSVTYLDGGNSIQEERWNGTLEQIFAVPTPLFVIVIGKILGSLLLGLLAFIPTVALAYFGFHAVLPGLDPLRFAVSLGILTFSFFVIAVSLTPLFAISRSAFTVLNGLELGVYGLCGFMFPVSQLPHWIQPVSYALSPTWATRALYASASPSASGDVTAWWLTAIGLSVIYLVISTFLYRFVETRARVTGQLALT
jgi:ABC-2 type transport system permease protein